MAIFITGDTHANFSRFGKGKFPEQDDLSKSDSVIICGDFGGVWAGSSWEQGRLDWLEEKPYTTLFVSGNHENYDLLAKYPVEEWHGGKVQRIRPSVIHLMRGQVYNIDGKTFFTMGGASSHDIQDGILDPDDPGFDELYFFKRRTRQMFRVKGMSWWPEELPSEAEYQTARENLEKHNWQVDYIVSHCCPDSIQDILGEGSYARDALTTFFEELTHRCQFTYWFFGHYHDNRVLQQKYVLLYENIVHLDKIEEFQTGSLTN